MRSTGVADWAGAVMAAQSLGYVTTWGKNPAEPIPVSLIGHALAAAGNGIIATVQDLRLAVFSEARLQWQQLRGGRPGELFGTPDLDLLETPWEGGTTGDLLGRALLDADLAGNAYLARLDNEIVRLRPDWVQILLAPRMKDLGDGVPRQLGWIKAGFAYYEGGLAVGKAAVLLPNQVAHFAPRPDPLATYRGMSWLTPVLREVEADNQATRHKQMFFENAATPNLAVSLPREIGTKAFREFVEVMESEHAGVENAYKTLYTGGGADVTVIGANMQQLDFAATQGKGETRIANAAGVPAVLAGLSEGLQGSSLNAGNYAAAKRRFADATIRPLWRNFAGSLKPIIPPPPAARLWYDSRDVAFLRDDEQDQAEIQSKRANTIRTLVDAGYTPESVIAAVEAENWTLLQHSGLYSVQLQPPAAATTTVPGEG
jgi:hypothetical protein